MDKGDCVIGRGVGRGCVVESSESADKEAGIVREVA
jgi:hypothetical protein